MKREHAMQTAPLCNKHQPRFPLRPGTKELRSLVQPVSNPPELRMARHSSAGTITKKKKSPCVQKGRTEQSRIEERERGPPSPRLSRGPLKHPHSRLRVRHCESTSWCLLRKTAIDYKNRTLKSLGKYQSKS